VSKALLYALIAAAGNVLGALAVTRRAVRELRVIELLVAFGAGFMLSVAIVELLPAALTRSGGIAPVLVLVGTSRSISRSTRSRRTSILGKRPTP